MALLMLSQLCGVGWVDCEKTTDPTSLYEFPWLEMDWDMISPVLV